MSMITSPGVSITVTNECVWTTQTIYMYRENYEKDSGRYCVVCPPDQFDELVEWCIENFGPRHKKRWGYSKSLTIYINNTEKAMAFKLKWIE